MLKTSKLTAAAVLKGVSMAALLSGALATNAHAEKPGKIKEMSITTQKGPNQAIRVISTDNKKWNKIKSGYFSFGAHVNIDTKHPGYVRHVGIILGACGGASCKGKPVLWSDAPFKRDYEKQMIVTFPTRKIPVSTYGIATVPFGDEIIAQCNSQVTTVGGNARSFNVLMPVTFAADTFKDIGFAKSQFGDAGPAERWEADVDHTKNTNVVVPVMCEPFQGEVAEDVTDDPDFGAKGVKVFLSTFVGQTSKPIRARPARRPGYWPASIPPRPDR